jgi:hypothetical protein
MVSLDTIRASNIQAGNLENLVAVFGMLFRRHLASSCCFDNLRLATYQNTDFCLILSSWRYEWSR